MASAFSLGQMIGPLIGSALTSRLSFAWASTLMAVGLLGHVAVVVLVDTWRPRPRERGGSYTELTAVPQSAADAAED